ncbi:hypothetical protein TRFO_25387 [Tritrichomonas foetus]|uniref:Uncharacterized protein n=1 Tax=Tritrichomonas foetus TaxID=1144522 RepID=A0A1J4K5Y4_9EUKA|nr:hypothetical protein TRFO_25387 [Tritrichomonas foetus]|eukprot:OHT06571.1 hypothetical protein TRFO_25387 [Tritrichomonas foetus]
MLNVGGSEVVNIDLSSEANVILHYPHQANNFLEARIIVSPENTTNYFLDPTQDAIISGSIIQLRVFDIVSIILSVWIIPKEMCPLVSFVLPEFDSFSLTLSSKYLTDSFCVFANDSDEAETYYYGSFSNSSSSRFEIYTPTQLFPFDVCYDKFCKIKTNGSVFFWYQSEVPVKLETFIRINGYNSSNDLSTKELNPLIYYNATNKYNVGKEIDTKTIKPITYASDERRKWSIIATVSTTWLMIVLIITKAIIAFILVHRSRKENRPISYDSTTAQPITLVLNQYCPNTSAKLIMPSTHIASYS